MSLLSLSLPYIQSTCYANSIKQLSLTMLNDYQPVNDKIYTLAMIYRVAYYGLIQLIKVKSLNRIYTRYRPTHIDVPVYRFTTISQHSRAILLFYSLPTAYKTDSVDNLFITTHTCSSLTKLSPKIRTLLSCHAGYISSAENTTIVTRVFIKNEFFISSESLFNFASTGVNFTLQFLIYLV